MDNKSESQKFKESLAASLTRAEKNNAHMLKYGRMENIKLLKASKRRLAEKRKQLIDSYRLKAE